MAQAGVQLIGGIEANRTSKKEARNARIAGQINASEVRREAEDVYGSIVANTAASGFGVGGATTEALIFESAGNAEFDAQMQIWQGVQKGAQIRNAGRSAVLNAIGGAAGNVAQAADNWGWFNRKTDAEGAE